MSIVSTTAPAVSSTAAIKPTRRAVIGAIAIAPTALSATSAPATFPAGSDPEWRRLVATFEMANAAYRTASDRQSEADDACIEAQHALSRPPEPRHFPDIIDGMNIAEIKAAGDTPEAKAAWAAHERELIEWQAKCDGLEQEIAGKAKAIYDAAYAEYVDAFNALTRHRISSLADLTEKMEIIANDYAGFDIPPEYFADVMADAQHLAGEA